MRKNECSEGKPRSARVAPPAVSWEGAASGEGRAGPPMNPKAWWVRSKGAPRPQGVGRRGAEKSGWARPSPGKAAHQDTAHWNHRFLPPSRTFQKLLEVLSDREAVCLVAVHEGRGVQPAGSEPPPANPQLPQVPSAHEHRSC